MVHAVNFERREYSAKKKKWQLVRDIMATDVSKYIFNLEDTDEARNVRYKESAVLTNFTKRTRDGLVGAVFTKAPEHEIPKLLNYVLDDVTGSRVGIHRIAKNIVSECLETGHGGILVEYPSDDPSLSDEERRELSIHARMRMYTAESIINWDTDRIGGEDKVTLIVLRENVSTLGKDGFSRVEKIENLVLRLEKVEDQYIYSQERLDSEGNPVKPKVFPTKADESYWDEIPFTFFGSEDNNPDPDESPLFDLSNLNIAHYRNSADNEENIYLCGQPFVVMTSSATREEFQQDNPEGLKVGARSVTLLELGADIKMAQTNPNDRIGVAMREKIEESAMVGARLITSHARIEKAESARMAYSSETSVMMTIVQNTNEAIVRSLIFCAMYEGADTENIEYALNQEFYDRITDAQVYMMLIQ